MKKNYNVPATEVVAFVGGAIMESASPGQTPAYPGGAGGSSTTIPGEG